MQPIVKWSGSKRSQADAIASRFPESYGDYYEPFIGGGSVLYAAAPRKTFAGDLYGPLIELWRAVRDEPQALAEHYAREWTRLHEAGKEHFYAVRERFNADPNPGDLLFLSRTCVNGIIRFNSAGQFNNSFHLTRPGIDPKRLERIVMDWSVRVQCAEFTAGDYRETTASAREGDLVYLDPPYFGTRARYVGNIDLGEFTAYLEDLNRRGVRFLLSLDGVRGDTDYRVEIPRELYTVHELIPSGGSAVVRVMGGGVEQVHESLYRNF